jgi:hypothetical protein
MDEMSVRLGDGTNLREASLFVDEIKKPEMLRTRAGGDQRLFEKIKVFLKNQKHEPNIVEVTHLCIMHRVHISLIYILKFLFWHHNFVNLKISTYNH